MHAAERWLVGRTDHFEVFSSGSEAETRRILTALEQFRAYFLASFPLRGASEPRTTIFLFDSDRAFRPYKPLYEGKPKDVAGYFLGGTDEVVIALTTDLPDPDQDPTGIIYHEYVHLLLHVRDAKLPVWINEGMAELFSTFAVADGKIIVGKAIDQHVAVLQHTALLPLERLFAVTKSSPDYNEEQRAGIFYAQSWALTHHLLCGEDTENANKFSEFIRLLSFGQPAEPSFKAAFRQDYAKMQLALRGYLNGGRYYTRSKPADLSDLKIDLRPALPEQREFALLNLRWRVHEQGDSALAALQLIERSPSFARPHELLAAIASSEGDTLTALNHWRLAADKLSDNAYVYVQLAKDALSAHTGAGILDARLPVERINQLRRWLGRALVLSPENQDALELAALTEALAESFDVRVINQVQKSVVRMRNPTRTLLALAIVRKRANDAKTALAMLDMLLEHRDADMHTRAAADALRDRLRPSGAEAAVRPEGPMQPRDFAAGAAFALKSRQPTAAEATLDRMLQERKTLAPRLNLEPLTVEAPRDASVADSWREVDEARNRAVKGDAGACFAVAMAHAAGIGAQYSPATAMEWLQRAASLGHDLAKSTATGDVTLACRFLRQQHPTAVDGALPPLDAELGALITDQCARETRRPVVILHRQAPRYPHALRQAGMGGEVAIELLVKSDGHAELLRTLTATDPALTQAVEEIVGSWRFLPSIRDGRPVRSLVRTTVQFVSK